MCIMDRFTDRTCHLDLYYTKATEKSAICVKFAAKAKEKTLEPLRFQGFEVRVIISC